MPSSPPSYPCFIATPVCSSFCPYSLSRPLLLVVVMVVVVLIGLIVVVVLMVLIVVVGMMVVMMVLMAVLAMMQVLLLMLFFLVLSFFLSLPSALLSPVPAVPPPVLLEASPGATEQCHHPDTHDWHFRRHPHILGLRSPVVF